MQRPKLSREFIASFLKDAIPEYEEILVSIEKDGGWLNLTPKFAELLVNLKAQDYPMFYRGEHTLNKALALSCLPMKLIRLVPK
jgi:hypothetical protein